MMINQKWIKSLQKRGETHWLKINKNVSIFKILEYLNLIKNVNKQLKYETKSKQTADIRTKVVNKQLNYEPIK